MNAMWLLVVYFLLTISNDLVVYGLENGLARTPPMGWLSWERFRCITNCTEYPNECINEQLFKNMADLMASDGYLEAGYEYVIIDDCWLAPTRDKNGKLQADPERFPNGIKPLADYIHSKGLKFGIYEDYGTKTCAGFPGSQGHEEIDAKTFAEWGVDYLKLDGCHSNPKDQENGTVKFLKQLNATGRPILFSCGFPFREYKAGIKTNYVRAAEICNLWRNYYDVQDSWISVTKILDYYKNNQDEFQSYAGPGHWNDPDMLVVGNFGLSPDQSRAQMGLWAILASPLLMSTDLRTIFLENKALLLNKNVIAINQDKLGIQGQFIQTLNSIDVYTKPIKPERNGNRSYAVAFLSRRDDGNPMIRRVTLRDIGLINEIGYEFEDVYNPGQKTILKPESVLEVRVNPSGIVLFKATIL